MENIIQFLESLSPWGNLCSIIGLGLSIWLMVQTGKIKENIDQALERNNRITNYINMRDDILNRLQECAGYLVNEHPTEEQRRYLTQLDSCLADLVACYPYMTANIKNDIDDIRNSCNDTYFSFVKIVRPLNNLISMLKMEAFTL